MKARWRIGTALACAGCATGAMAQPAANTGGVGAGGFPQRQFEVAATGRATYDTNVARGRVTRNSRVRSKDDIILTPGLSAAIILPISRQDVFLNGSAGYNFYTRNTRLNRETINLAGGAHLRAGTRCMATPAVSWRRGLSDLGDILGGVNATNTEQQIDVGVDATCGGVQGLSVGGGYHRNTIRNSTAVRRLLDVSSDTVNASVGLSGQRVGTVSVYGTYMVGRYPNRFFPTTAGGLERDGVRTYSAGLQYQRMIGTALTGAASVGLTRVDPRTPGVKDFKGLSYSVNMTYSRDPIQVTVSGARQAQQSNIIASSYNISTSAGVAGSYALTQQLRLNASVDYIHRDFEASPFLSNGVVPADPLANFRPSDQTFLASVGAGYRLNDRIGLTADVAHERRRSPLSFFDYNSTRFVIGARVRL